MPCLQGFSGVLRFGFKNADCGKFEQILVSCDYLLVVRLVVKQGWVTTKAYIKNNAVDPSSTALFYEHCFNI
jgi:hypothetical protein